MNIVNLTPHPVTLRNAAGVDTSIPSSGLCRVDSSPGVKMPVSNGPCDFYSATSFGAVSGLPDPMDGTIYIVSMLVAGLVRRPDVFSPGTGPNDGAVRNDKGQIAAVTRLIGSMGILEYM